MLVSGARRDHLPRPELSATNILLSIYVYVVQIYNAVGLDHLLVADQTAPQRSGPGSGSGS